MDKRLQAALENVGTLKAGYDSARREHDNARNLNNRAFLRQWDRVAHYVCPDLAEPIQFGMFAAGEHLTITVDKSGIYAKDTRQNSYVIALCGREMAELGDEQTQAIRRELDAKNFMKKFSVGLRTATWVHRQGTRQIRTNLKNLERTAPELV